MNQYDSVIFNHLKWNRHWRRPQTETVRVHKKFRWSWSGWAWPCNDFYLDRPLLCSWYHLVFKWSSAASYTTKESYFLTFSSKSLFSKFPGSVEYQKISKCLFSGLNGHFDLKIMKIIFEISRNSPDFLLRVFAQKWLFWLENQKLKISRYWA